VKVQTVGPCTFTLTNVDQAKRALFYNEGFREMAAKALGMKCRWQIDTFKPYADRVICFLDEPILSAFGSSTYVSVQREDVVALLREVVEPIRSAGALCGVHCCGNTGFKANGFAPISEQSAWRVPSMSCCARQGY